MSTRTWDSSTVEGCLAELAHQRAEFLRIHEQDCREKRALEKRAARAEAESLAFEADAHGDARAWDGNYVKEHYILTTPAKERVLCWPNAGYMTASDGSGRQWAPCADLLVERIDLDKGLRIVRGERKP